MCVGDQPATRSGVSAGARWPTPSSTTSRPSLHRRPRSAANAFRRRRDVLCARDRQHRGGDLRQPVGDVEGRERIAHMRIRLGVGVAQGAEQGALTTDGSRPANPAANQRCGGRRRPSTRYPMSRTVAARSRHCSGSPITAPVHSRAAERTRSGASSSNLQPDRSAHRVARIRKACPGAMSSASASTPAASSAILNGPDAAGLRPCPGRSQPDDADVFGKAFGDRAPEVGDRCAERRAEQQQARAAVVRRSRCTVMRGMVTSHP